MPKSKIMQGELMFPNRWGGRREGAGRPRKKGKRNVEHRTRPVVAARFPVHLSVRLEKGVRNLRKLPCLRVIERAFNAAQGRFGLRLNHFTVQSNHLHLIVETTDRVALARAVKGLNVRIAKGLNRLMGRRGKVVGDRYHAHILKTPAEVRNAVHYVLGNLTRHTGREGVDAYCSLARPDLVVAPRTWLLVHAPPPS
jgi:REP element-mobilizing transposase RayT